MQLKRSKSFGVLYVNSLTISTYSSGMFVKKDGQLKYCNVCFSFDEHVVIFLFRYIRVSNISYSISCTTSTFKTRDNHDFPYN